MCVSMSQFSFTDIKFPAEERKKKAIFSLHALGHSVRRCLHQDDVCVPAPEGATALGQRSQRWVDAERVSVANIDHSIAT